MTNNSLKLGHCLRILHLNIEGISAEKTEVLMKIIQEKDIDVVCLQETHSKNDEDLYKREFISGFDMIEAIHDSRYGIATYVRSNIQDCKFVQKECINNIAHICIEINGIHILNVYNLGSTWNTSHLDHQQFM